MADQIQEDRNALTDLMRRLGIGADPLKRALAWWAEKLGRGKLNGSLISYSPLSRLEELEFLSLGVEGKLLMWLALRELADHDDRIAAVDLERLIRRARAQRRRLERHRLAAATEALME